MARLQTYEQQINVRSAQAPDDIGAGARAVGRGIAQVGEGVAAVGEAVQVRDDRKEASKIAREGSLGMANLTAKWEETKNKADPNDPDVAKRFITEEVEPTIANLRKLATSKRSRALVDDAGLKLTEHFTIKSISDMTDLEADQAVQDFNEGVRDLALTANTDPAGLDSVLAMYDTMTAGMLDGHVDTVKRTEALQNGREVIVQGALLGKIKANPEAAKKEIEDGKYDAYLTVKSKASLVDEADQTIRAAEVNDRQAIQAEKDLREQVNAEQQSDWLTRKINGEVVNANEIIDSEQKPNVKQSYLRMFGFLKKEGSGADSSTFNSAFNRAYKEPGDPDRLTEDDVMAGAGTLYTPAQVNHLLTAIRRGKTSEGQEENRKWKGLERHARAIFVDGALPDPNGQTRMMVFMENARKTVADAQSKGEPINEFFDPSSKKWLGLQATPPSIQEVNQAIIAGSRGAVAPPNVSLAPGAGAPKKVTRKPGESASAYLARAKGGGASAPKKPAIKAPLQDQPRIPVGEEDLGINPKDLGKNTVAPASAPASAFKQLSSDRLGTIGQKLNKKLEGVKK